MGFHPCQGRTLPFASPGNPTFGDVPKPSWLNVLHMACGRKDKAILVEPTLDDFCITCATVMVPAACASLTLLLEDKTQLALKTIHEGHQQGLSYLSTQGSFIKYRSLGTIAAFDLPQTNSVDMKSLKQAFLNQGLLIRPIGKAIYLLPPYTITSSELERTYERIEAAVTIKN